MPICINCGAELGRTRDKGLAPHEQRWFHARTKMERCVQVLTTTARPK